MIGIFLKGLVIGISIAAPVGPIGILCIKRTLNEGRSAGLVTGMGAATADAFYGIIAGFGLTTISSLLLDHSEMLNLLGGLFLCYLGIKTLLSKPAEESIQAKGKGLLSYYTTTVGLTLTNPMTILSFMAVFAGLGVVSEKLNYLAATTLVAGVFAGSGIWWLFLTTFIGGILRGRITKKGLGWINRFSGLIIIGFGVFALLHLWFGKVF